MPADPQIRRLLDDAYRADPRGIEQLSVAEARTRGGTIAVASVPYEEVADVRDVVIDAAHGVSGRLYRPHVGSPPLIVYFHGGGWVVGSIALSDAFCRSLANASRAAVLSVEYRLAPEHRYPAAVDDASSALTWAAAHASELGVDAARLVVAGSSAGGTLAAVAARRAAERGGPRLALQVLHVPVTDHDFARPSYRAYATGHGLTRAAMEWFWDHYAPDRARRDEPDASPLRAADLRGLPPAIVITAECDPLRDEGAEYAARLGAAGVAVTQREYSGMVHAFMGWSSVVPTGARAMRELGYAVRARIG